jgi:uncharacterized protein
VRLTLVANQSLRLPKSPHVRFVQVPPGFNVADERIVASIGAGDLVVTADIPLAAAVIERGALALDPRGELYTVENVRERLSMRNFLDELRGGGVVTGGPAALGPRHRQAFAAALDGWLARRARTLPGQEPGAG